MLTGISVYAMNGLLGCWRGFEGLEPSKLAHFGLLCGHSEGPDTSAKLAAKGRGFDQGTGYTGQEGTYGMRF